MKAKDFETAVKVLAARSGYTMPQVARGVGIDTRNLTRRLGAMDGERSSVQLLVDICLTAGWRFADLVEEASRASTTRQEDDHVV
tara:strand:+ start:36837 stop:37091 length:255 start_codon:yes stop_codon:yes gene_type:complete